MTCWPEGGPGLEPGTDMFGIAGTAELSTFCPGTGTWNRLQDGINVVATQARAWGHFQQCDALQILSKSSLATMGE